MGEEEWVAGGRYHSEPPPSLPDATTRWLLDVFFFSSSLEWGKGQWCRGVWLLLGTQNCAAARLGFMGKRVSHHCVLIGCQTLAERCVNVCVGNRRCLLQRAVQAQRRACHRLQLLLLRFSCCPHCFYAFFRRRRWFLLKCGDSRCGLASGVSGSREQQGCVPWAACSPSQRTGEMLLKGQ